MPPKKNRPNRASGSQKRTSSASDGQPAKHRAPSVHVPLDSWECPICKGYTIGKIFQCALGHHLCEECLQKVRASGNNCPSCKAAFPAEPIRNLALEHMSSTVIFPCLHGCGWEGTPENIRQHAEACEYKPFKCLKDDCNYQGPAKSIPSHIRREHQGDYSENDCAFVAPQMFTPPTVLDPVLHTVRSKGGKAEVAFVDGHTEGDWFQGCVVHFTKPAMFELSLEGPGKGGITVRAPSCQLAANRQPNVRIHKSQLEPFLYTHEDGDIWLDISLSGQLI